MGAWLKQNPHVPVALGIIGAIAALIAGHDVSSAVGVPVITGAAAFSVGASAGVVTPTTPKTTTT